LCLNKFHITEVVSQYFPSELNQFMNSLQNSNRLPMGFIYSVGVAVVIISAIFCVSTAYRWWRPGGRPEPLVSDLLGVILVGIVSNAALTGILSDPLDRYEGRVIWLLPFFVVLVFGRLTGFRPQPDQPEAFRNPAAAAAPEKRSDTNWKRSSIITTEASKLGSEVHDRMPVIITPADYQLWLTAPCAGL
jgi:SOS response associated peptidase (SRAP)